MKLSKKETSILTFKHIDTWYKITYKNNDISIYYLYKVISDNDFEPLGTGNSPKKLEDKVYAGKYS